MRAHWAAAATVTVAAAAVIVGLVGCAPVETDAVEPPVDTPNPVVTESAEPPAAPLRFSQPASCAEMLPATRITDLESRGLVLLGGPGGRYGTQYLGEPSPEERLGGMTCIWGESGSEISSIAISVAPLAPSSRPSVIDTFVADGLNEGELDDASTFSVQGDTTLVPAIYHELRNDSWISVIMTVGGSGPYNEAIAISAEVAATVYR